MGCQKGGLTATSWLNMIGHELSPHTDKAGCRYRQPAGFAINDAWQREWTSKNDRQ